ncbi:YPDG domain-containing protein, partial [Streptococcus acidominimus]
MENHNRRKFDWYGMSQRFSIRKYHFGAASVLLGTAMMLAVTPANAAAEEVATDTTSSSTAEVAADTASSSTAEVAADTAGSSTAEVVADTASSSTAEVVASTINSSTAEVTKSEDSLVADQLDLSVVKTNAILALDAYTHISAEERANFVAQINTADNSATVEAVLREAKSVEERKIATTQPVHSRTAFRKVSGPTYKEAIATINALTHLNDIEKSYYLGQISEQTKGLINKDARVAEILTEAQTHDERVSVNRGTSEADAIESANVTKDDKNTISGDVRLKYAGNVNDNSNEYVKGLGGVTVYAQWYEKNGLSSPIYKTVTKEDGSFAIGMAPFIGADGKKWTFNAYASLGSGDANAEKWRIWSVNPDTNKYELLYSYGEEQISPEGSALDTTAGAGNETATQRLTNIEIQYAYKNSDVWKQDAKQTPASPDKNEGGLVSGSVYWNNNNPQGSLVWDGLISRQKADIGLAGVNVYASYLSDYAVTELNKLETLQQFVAVGSTWTPKVNKDKSSNIRGTNWTRENEEKLREYLIAQIAANRSEWIAETVVAQTDAKGEYKLQFNGTFGQAWNNSGFDGIINSRDSVLLSNQNVTNGSGVTKKGTEWKGTVADSPSYGKFGSTGVDSGLDLNKAPKHINLDWLMVIAELEGVSFTTPFYGDVPRAANSGAWGDTLPTFWNVNYNIGTTEIPGNNNATNIRFAAFHNDVKFDIVNYDSYSNYASPGDTAIARTTGVKAVSGEYYKIVWKDENGKVVDEGTAVQAGADGTLPDSTFTTPSDLTKTTTYFAELYAVNEDGTLPDYPIQTDSFTVVYKLLPKYEVTYADQGATDTASANPTFDVAHTKDIEEKLAIPEGATFSFVSTDGSEEAPSNFSIDPKTGVITWKNATEDTSIDVLVTYADGTTASVTAEFKLNRSETETDKYTPAYTNTEVKAGQSAASAVPNFTDKDGATATPSATVTYKLGDISGLPAGVTATIDSATGVVTLVTSDGIAIGTEINVPVVVTYNDQTEDTATATFTVIESDKDKYTPTYTDVTGKPGETVITETPNFTPELSADVPKPNYAISSEQPAGTTPLPAGATATIDPEGKVSVTIPSDAVSGTEYTIPVEVTYGDGSKDVVSVKVTVVAPADTPSVGNIDDKTVIEKQPIAPIDVPVDNKPANGTVEVTGLPGGLTYDPATGKITGTPSVTDWGTTEEERDFPVKVVVKDENGNPVAEKTFTVKVQRDTDGDQDPDVTDPDDDNDGFTDDQEKTAGTDPKDPTSKPTTPSVGNIDDKTVIEKQPIEAIDVPVENKPANGTVEVTGLPSGLTYDPATGKITGTPSVTDWGTTEEERDFPVKVVVKDENGNPVAEKTFTVKVQRDTDGDQDPDVTDPDDDNDGFTDDQEKTAGTDPKDPTSKPTTPSVGNIDNKTVIEKQPIEAIDVPVENKPANGTVEVTGLPGGLTYDPATGKITGTPSVTDWGTTEEERDFPVKVVVKDENGNPVAEKTFTVKVQRDTDGDQDPDVTDPDDDNDGFTDDQEKTAGTDPKDPNSKPVTPSVGNIDNKTVIEKQPIEAIDVPVDNKPANGTVEVSGLPDGLTYDPATGKITGTPSVTDWGTTEEERDFPVKVVVKDENGNPVAEKTFTVKVQRDTDGDQDPDVTDPDDDNDGYTDDQEKTANTDPKDPNSKPTAA